jgi:hypothetical protein
MNNTQAEPSVRQGILAGSPVTSPKDKAFYAFWYGHMLDELMQPPLANVDHSTARYIWDAATQSQGDEIVRLRADVERLKAGLKWYADGSHVVGLDDDWDTVSGEPQNWLCGPESGMVENGGVAKTVMDGGYIVDDEEIIAEPAMTAEQHKTKLARVEELMMRNPDADSADGMELQQLAGEVERHEKRAFPITTTEAPRE